MFEPHHNPPNQSPPIPQSIYQIPETTLETTYEIPANPYQNFYAVSQPYLTQHILIPEQTAGNKTHKWWSFHNLKEKFKSIFKRKHKDDTQNSANLFNNNQAQLQPGKISYERPEYCV